jgi:hypothetical protein
MRTTSKNMYNGLCTALLGNISDADQTKITNTDINDRKIVYFSDIINCFQGVEHLTSKEMNSCICGKKHISDNYLIRNKTTLDEYIVGSTCARNWFKEDKIKDGCKYCGRMSKNCGNCKNCSGKANMKSVFSGWRKEVSEKKEKVTFGKYKDILTYRQLCTDIKYKSYVEWCLNMSQMNAEIKERLQYFSDKSGKEEMNLRQLFSS